MYAETSSNRKYIGINLSLKH